MTYQMRNWYYFTWLSGDHIVEQHIHNLDVINWLTGKFPIKANGMGGRQVRTEKEYGQIFDHHAVEYEYEGGLRMISQCRHMKGCWESVSEHVAGSKGICNIGGGKIEGANPWQYRPRRPIPTSAPIPTRSSTRCCKTASAAATRSTRPSTAPKAR